MALKGKFLRREGTFVYFGSRNKPEWKPMELTGHVDASQLVPGSYYGLQLDGNRLVGIEPLGDRPAPPQAETIDHTARRFSGVSPDSLMASATGFAKSAMEGGLCKTWNEAARAGVAWAKLWENGVPDRVPGPGEAAPPAPPADEPDDNIPF